MRLRARPRAADARLDTADARLIALVDAAFADGARKAGSWCACREGCTPCCVGPFPITMLDAWRLQTGMDALRRADPAVARAVARRARDAVEAMGPAPAGEDDEAFCERHASLPCPALDPGSGRCDLYRWRPISCRTYGPPVRFGGDDLPACDLWFVGAAPEAVERARVEPDPDDLEGALLRLIEPGDGPEGHTYVAYALLGTSGAP